MPTDTHRHPPLQPGRRPRSGSATAKGDIPGGGTGCLYRPVREEDVNVDLGNQFTPAIPPPPCTGDDHVIDQSTLVTRSNYFGVAGAHAPLCDKRLVVLQNEPERQRRLQPDDELPHRPQRRRTRPTPGPATSRSPAGSSARSSTTSTSSATRSRPGTASRGRSRSIPVGIYARVDTAADGTSTSRSTPTTGGCSRRSTTSPDGSFEALVPSTETLNCPIPQGPCPGMYLVKVDDPGIEAASERQLQPEPAHGNDAGRGLAGPDHQLDLPLDPISGTGCEDPAVPAAARAAAGRQPGRGTAGQPMTIQADFIGAPGTATGATGVRATLTDDRTGQVATLTRANGGIVSWTPGSGEHAGHDRLIQIPAFTARPSAPGPKQLT